MIAGILYDVVNNSGTISVYRDPGSKIRYLFNPGSQVSDTIFGPILEGVVTVFFYCLWIKLHNAWNLANFSGLETRIMCSFFAKLWLHAIYLQQQSIFFAILPLDPKSGRQDPGSGQVMSGSGTGIQDKHPGLTTQTNRRIISTAVLTR